MFCGSCGAELPPNAKFCKECGTPVAMSAAKDSGAPQVAPANSGTSSETADSVSLANASGRSLQDGKGFSQNLAEPVTNVPTTKTTGNGLLDSLNAFGALYHTFIDNMLLLLDTAKQKEALEQAGPNWYYGHSDDEVVVASRKINAELAKAQQSLKEARESIAKNAQARADAAAKRDAHMRQAQNMRTNIMRSGRGLNIAIGVVAVIFILLFLSMGSSAAWAAAYMFIIAGGFLVWRFVVKKSRAKKVEKTANASHLRVDAEYEARSRELAKSDEALSAQATQLEGQISALLPKAGEVRHFAMERCEFLFAVETNELSQRMFDISNICKAQHDELVAMEVLRDENEWFEIDRVTKFVATGRADTLKEALVLLDTANYREQDLAQKNALIDGQRLTNDILQAGFSAMLEAQQASIAEQRKGFESLQAQQQAQHAQEMSLQTAALEQQAIQIANQAAQNANLESIASGVEQQTQFNQEVRDRFNWNEYNRPDQVIMGDPTVGRNGLPRR